jgi:hypothetical protein
MSATRVPSCADLTFAHGACVHKRWIGEAKAATEFSSTFGVSDRVGTARRAPLRLGRDAACNAASQNRDRRLVRSRLCSAPQEGCAASGARVLTQEKGGQRDRLLLPFSYPLLTEMHSSVFTAEHGAGLTDEAVRSAVAMVIRIVVRVAIAAEWHGRDGTCGTDRAANHAGRYVIRPESAVAMLDHARGTLVMPHHLWARHVCCANAGAAIAVDSTVRSFKFIHCLHRSDTGPTAGDGRPCEVSSCSTSNGCEVPVPTKERIGRAWSTERFANTSKSVIARLDRATQYCRALMSCSAPNKRSGILGPRLPRGRHRACFRGDDG